jgi:hypothetical protein
MGWQDMPKVVHEAASRKGGKVRVKKGLASLSPERRKEIATMGGKARVNRDTESSKQKEASGDSQRQRLADILGDIDEI